MRRLTALLFVLVGWAQPAWAESPDAEEPPTPPVLPPSLYPQPSSYWVVGVAAERFGSDFVGNDFLVGLDVTRRFGPFGPHALVMLKPGPWLAASPEIGDYQDYRALAGLGLRGYFPALGTEWSVGVGLHAEVRLEDNYWTLHMTPLELGVVLWGEGSWNIELFYGARRVAHGGLIDYFLLDPNGIDREAAQADLDERLHDQPWQGFLRLVFGRRID